MSRSLPPLSLFGAPWSSSRCRAGVPKDGEPPGVHLVVGRAAAPHHRLCHVVAVCARRAPRARSGRECCYARRPASRQVGRRQATPGHYWLVLAGHLRIVRSWPSWNAAQRLGFNWKSFFNFFGLNSYLNLENSYLSIQSSRNYKTSAIGFVIF
jgi:hypothetical protein